jgi:ribonuclease Z
MAIAQLALRMTSAALAAVAAAAVLQATTVQGPPAPLRTQVVLLGTGTPNADPDRSGPSTAVVVDDVPYIVDFGPGVVRRAAAAFKKGVKGLEAKRLRIAFATHLHSDHTAGLPDLILTPAVLERNAPFDLFGPPGTEAMATAVMKAWAEDLEVRLYGGEPSMPAGYEVRAHDVRPGVIYKDARVTVTAFAVKHGTWPHAYGYRFDTPDRAVVVSGDCTMSESIVEHCRGCDVLVHEVYSVAGLAQRPPEWQKYHTAFHTASTDLAKIATRARPGLLVLTHQLVWGATDETLLAEVRAGYAGKVVSGKDLDVY